MSNKKTSKITYKDGYFEAGELNVSESEHKENSVYLDINGDIFELTEDEALAIANVIINLLWQVKSDNEKQG